MERKESEAPATREVPIVTDVAASCGELVDGRYLLVDQLGEGSMGTVFLASDTRLKREVALKIARPSIVCDPRLRVRLQREAEAMARLRHHNVVEIYDVGTWTGCPYFVMPYLHGSDLNAWCRQRGGVPVDVDVAVGILAQVCAGLAAMHAVGLVHRDVKPSNILVSTSFEVTVGDLGLAHDALAGPELADMGGTPGFLAPELVLDHEVPPTLAAKADTYAVGVTAYWLLTGTRPTTSNLDELVASFPIEIQPPSARRPGLPAAFDAPILAALHEDPRQRTDVLGFREALLGARAVTSRLQRARSSFVVVVDDDPHALLFVEGILRAAVPSVELATFRDPRAALAVIESRPPDLVISDLAMPDVNGVELTAAIRGNARTREVPIVIFSGVGSAADWQVLERIGATRFVVKPVDPDTFSDVVCRVLKLH
jgi:eukaryotic-like serine/threonine-protein kinase